VFAFNEQVDRAVLSPLARGYRAVVPSPVRRGVSNFFANLGDIGGTVNAGLQGNAGGAARNGGRFLLNSTLGLGGVFDVATRLGIRRYQTDFGHTLAVWGAPRGAYIVLPLLGPATTRSGIGQTVDLALRQQMPVSAGTTVATLEVVDTRAALVPAEGLLSGDRYLFVREAYLQRRAGLTGETSTAAAFADDAGFDWGD
jgi:phospholipid-binding lipoprotein MlaA